MALLDGTLPPVSLKELCSRLQHYSNVLEIVCLSSNLSDFDNNSWKVGKEYDSRVVATLELGLQHWETLSPTIDPTALVFAKEVHSRSKVSTNQTKTQSNGGSSNAKLCTTYNTFRKDGCSFEHNNPGEVCIFQHVCSTCRSKGLVRKHKAWQCQESQSSSQSTPVSSAAINTAAPVTSG